VEWQPYGAVFWSASSASAKAHYQRGFWHAQRSSERWCFPRGVSKTFPLISQWEHATPSAQLAASSVASGRIDHVERIRLTSASQFESKLLAKDVPTVIEGLTEGWPAWLGDTSAEGQLARHAGDAKMRVEKSANGRFGHVEPSWGDTAMTLREFFAAGHCERAGGTAASAAAAAAGDDDGDEKNNPARDIVAKSKPEGGGGEVEGEEGDEEAAAPLLDSQGADGEEDGREGGVPGGGGGGGGGDGREHMYLSFNPPDDILRAMAMEQWPVPCLAEAGGFSAAVRELLVWIGTGTDSTVGLYKLNFQLTRSSLKAPGFNP
jgi:hypothetical protein